MTFGTSALTGCVAGVAGLRASAHAGTWLVAPALMVWACALAAAATCDAFTQRVPTALVRLAGLITGVLLLAGLSWQNDWRGLLVSGWAAVAAGLALLLCWRFAGAGFGDLRLATLGGLGLGHATFHGALVGLLVFSMITLIQAGVAIARGGNRHTHIPLGPALATGFLVAAAF